MAIRKSLVLLTIIFGILFLLSQLFSGCNSQNQENNISENVLKDSLIFTGSISCKSCHLNEYDDWRKSDHFFAMQLAADSTVLGDFNNKSFNADGVSSRFFKKNGKFIINTEGDDGKNKDYEVLYTFGYFPLQQYLVSFPNGRLQATRVSWNSREKKWFNQYAGEKINHRDWIHWTGNGQNWNTMCASCHSTNLKKNYDYKTDSYNTSWNEINVTCESCHGPGSRHINFVNSTEFKNGERIKNSGLIYSRDTIAQLQVNTCAPCHARKSDLSEKKIQSVELLDDFIPQLINDEFYFPDGQIKQEDYEYGSFTQSKMFHKNVRCSNCHNPHSGKLKLTGNNLCVSCHTSKYDNSEHHYHAMNTDGAQCINCHMAEKTFMGIDHRRDHSFRIPRPDQSVMYGTPNACNNCHTHKSAKWAMNEIIKRFGTKRAYHFSDDLIPGSRLDENSERHLVKLLADTSVPVIARATAAEYLGKLLTVSAGDALLSALNDKNAVVRYYSLRALENFNPETWHDKASKLLGDKVRAVRISAAGLFHRLPPDAITETEKNVYDAADVENKDYLNYQSDFSVGNVMLADYDMQGRDYVNAIEHYLRGLKKDSIMNYARLNLSAAYNSLGKNDVALKVLMDAAAIDPSNDRIFYNLGLLNFEMGDTLSALKNFKKSELLGSVNPGLYYNYGLLLFQLAKLKDAERVLLKGYSIDPQAMNINYALAYLYSNEKLFQKARMYAEVLKKYDPNNQQYQSLFNQLGL